MLDPDHVQHVLLDNAANYAKPDIVQTLLDPIIGKGLLTSDASLWREQRRIVAASFSPAAVEAQRGTFVQAARAAMDRWSDGERRDMAAEATRTTMTIIALALFGGDPRLISEESMRQITAAIEGFSEARMLALLRLPQFPVTPKGRAGKRGQVHLRKTLTEVVDDRWHGRIKGDFLCGMIDALRERFPEAEARALAVDNAATFYLAGHETTANALSWTLFLLAAQPELQEELAVEARTALAGGDDDVAERLPRLRLFLSESLAALSAGAAVRPPGDRPGPARRMGGEAGRHRFHLAVAAAPPSGAVGRSRRLRHRPLRRQERPAPLPIFAVRSGAADLRRRPVRDERSADRARPLAGRLAVRRCRPPGARGGDGDPAAGRRPASGPQPPLMVFAMLTPALKACIRSAENSRCKLIANDLQ